MTGTASSGDARTDLAAGGRASAAPLFSPSAATPMAPTAMVAGLLRRWRNRMFRHAPDDAGEVSLHHARIYILPTRSGLAVIATVATMLLTALNYGLALGYLVTFLLSGLCAAALLHTFRNLSGLSVRPGPCGETFAGGSIPFTLLLAAKGRGRIGLAVEARAAKGVRAPPCCIDVDADATCPVVVDVAAPQRGPVPLGRVTISSDHPLGLWRAWAYVHFPVEGLAYPAPEPAAPPLPAAPAGADDAGVGRQEDGDLAGIRTYQRGDPLQRVAWKTVARGGGWYTKQFDRAGGGGEVVLDFFALPGSLDTEGRLARLCAWALACERAARPCALVLPGRRVPTGAGRDHRRQVLSALALHGVR